ncbi:MAG: tetratricopeptide repeat protein [Acidobacteria bacterium]|nr:tetratricopeptide repeat protein [Acidobacteriota bacterium]
MNDGLMKKDEAMMKIEKPSRRAALVALLFVLALCAMTASAAMSQHRRASRRRQTAQHNAQQSNAQPTPAPKRPKKLPPGTRGFEQFANRDASDKLITGGATRGEGNDAAEREAIASLDSGKESYKSGDYAAAAAAFRRAADLEPTWFRAEYRLGMAYEALNKYADAAAAYAKAVALTPDVSVDEAEDFYKAQYNLANAYALAGQHDAAIKTYQQLLDSTPVPLSRPYYNMGLSYAALGKTAEATAAFKKAVEISPDFAEAHYNLGLACARAEQYQQAADEFKRAIRLKPDYAEAHYNLGLVYYITDDRAGLASEQRALAALKSSLAAELAKLR